MTTPQVNQYLSAVIADTMSQTQQSVKPDGTALSATPQDGGALVAGWDRTNALQRHLNVNSTGAVIVGNAGGNAVTGAFDSGAVDETSIGLFVRAAVTGQNRAAAANAKNKPINSDLMSAISGANQATGTIEALYTTSLIAGLASGNIAGVLSSQALTAQAYTGARLEVDSVVRGDDGATYSAVGVRGSSGSQALALIRLLVDSASRSFDTVTSTYIVNGGSGELTGNGVTQQLMLEGRRSAYYTSLKGRRYVCKSPNLTGVAAATALTTTAPTFLIVCGATKAIVIRRIRLCLPVRTTSTSFRLLVKTDTANRFSSGGTARAPAALNNGNILATGLAQNLEAPTATAEGGGTLDVWTDCAAPVSGSEINYEPEDGLIIVKSGSLLMYAITATVGETVDYEVEYEEAAVQ